MTNLNRRNFLKATALGAGLLMLPSGLVRMRAQDKPEAKGGEKKHPALVVVFLRGGADALNVVVPFADKRYYELRPTIAIPEKGDGAVLPLDKQFGLHPSLDALLPWYEKKRLAPLVCVGSTHATRSHFDAQDFMEYAAPGNRTVRAGWLNRMLEATHGEEDSKLRALAMQGLLPRALRGDYSVLAVPDKKVLKDDELLELFDDLYGEVGAKEPANAEMEKREDDSVRGTGRDTVETLKHYREIMTKPVKGERAKFPAGKLGDQLKDVAQVMRADAGLELACVDVGGWDDHVNEGGSEGNLADRLKILGDALGAFATDIGDRLDDTLNLCMSEFGRTARENGNSGTDHGHGGFMFLLAGKVNGGTVHGKWNGLKDEELYQKRDLAVTTDFRDVFNEVLTSHVGHTPNDKFFPGYTPNRVKGLFKA